MSKNLNLEGTQNTENQKNNMSPDELKDGARNSKTLHGHGIGPRPDPEAPTQDTISAFGSRGSKQD